MFTFLYTLFESVEKVCTFEYQKRQANIKKAMTDTTTLLLTQKAIDAVKNCQAAKNRLQFELKVSPSTVHRWLKSNDIVLTTAHSMKIISEETGLSPKELLNVA